MDPAMLATMVIRAMKAGPPATAPTSLPPFGFAARPHMMPTLPGGTLPPTATAAAMLSALGGLQGAPPPKFPAAAPAPMVPAEPATLPAMAGVAHAEPSKTSPEPAQTHVSQGGSSRGPSKG